ncbi:MAG: hypothetical protein KDD11_04515 [Acidobacteria bacterium]|nr:hypothetical protein [Acidobacteriota bacterium]
MTDETESFPDVVAARPVVVLSDSLGGRLVEQVPEPEPGVEIALRPPDLRQSQEELLGMPVFAQEAFELLDDSASGLGHFPRRVLVAPQEA